MVKALLQQQFPRVHVRGIADEENTGNFTVFCQCSDIPREVMRHKSDVSAKKKQTLPLGTCVWPYGFVSTCSKQRELLVRVRAHLSSSRDCSTPISKS